MSKKNHYNPSEVEEKFYKFWEEQGFFEIDGNKAIQNGKNFCIMMPPPNVTGHLHIGHALTFTLQDIIVRYKRMDGFKTLWQPGVDHAGIATQNVVEKKLLAQGKTKEEIGREAFLKLCWKQKESSQNAITKQLRKLGVSPAWSRERFTMDEGLANAVKKAFKIMYDNGYIFQGNYMINWCTHDGALSDIEVEYKEHDGKLYHIKYPLVDGSGEVIVATTRPETYFGDTAVMVHPKDERYKNLIGKKVRLPLIDREIEIIADSHVDKEFGTGIVKVTPAHDPNDYEVGKRHNLEFITIFDEKGILNSYCGEFEGLERLEAREKIVEKLQKEGFIEKIEEHKHQVGHCYRCNNVVEPYISKQWFVSKDFAKRTIQEVNSGKVTFFPAHWINSYNAWMRDLRDWCISRQLWWGHQIPVANCKDCGHQWAFEAEKPTECPKCHSHNIYQEEDVLDTWFSSGLWPFSTLGWGNRERGKGVKWNEEDMKEFYPNSLLITGFDILFFWVARMLMMGRELAGVLPFPHIYLHALVKDEHGHKMSKSRGNVIDPLEMVQKYSADALRFTLAILAVQGRDIKLSQEKLEQSRNFTNKLYNAANYLLMHIESFKDLDEIKITTPLAAFMLDKFNKAIVEVRKYLNEYRFNDAATTLYRFLWGEFCDWGIELSKANKDSISELGAIYKESLKLLHPFMPFISEYLYQKLSNQELNSQNSIMIQKYPMPREVSNENIKDFDLAIEAIVSIRRAKTLVDLANKKIDKAYVEFNESVNKELIKPYIEKLSKVEVVEFVNSKPQNAVTDVSTNLKSYIKTDDIDLKPIIERYKKQEEKLTKEINKLQAMLNNEKFLQNAPANIIEQNKETLKSAHEKLQKLQNELKAIQGE